MSEQNSKAGYKYLLTYQYSSVIYDLTVEFCLLFLPGRELLRQRDQMTQAARSGKQNIVEGYELQSLESYIKFLGIAKCSLKELLEDYEDFLRQRGLALWSKDDPRMRKLRDLRAIRGSLSPSPPIPPYSPRPRVSRQSSYYALSKNYLSLRKTNSILKGEIYSRRRFSGKSLSATPRAEKTLPINPNQQPASACRQRQSQSHHPNPFLTS